MFERDGRSAYEVGYRIKHSDLYKESDVAVEKEKNEEGLVPPLKVCLIYR